jgi:ribosome-associated protein
VAERPEVVEVGEGIRLGQLLKLAGMVDSGGEAKAVLAAGEVVVNGAVESRRGAQLRTGDVVRCRGREVVVG